MANRYWIGANATWDSTTTTYWSATSGGAGGASVPTAADDVYINQINQICVIAEGYTAQARSLSLSAGGASLMNGSLTLAGSLTLGASVNWFVTGTLTFTGTGSISNAGASNRFSNTSIAVSSGSTSLPSSFQCKAVTVSGGTLTTYGLNCTTLTLTGGTLNLGTAGATAESLATSGTTARTLTLGSGSLTLTGATAVNFAAITGLTMTANTATISINGSGASQVIDFGGATIHNLSLANASATSFRFSGNVTANRVASARSGSYTVNIDAAKTITTTEWEVTGTVGNIVSLRCTTPDSQGNITKVGGGTSSTAYMSVKDIHAEPALTFVSTQSTDDGNNTNWFFEAFYKLNSLLYGSPM